MDRFYINTQNINQILTNSNIHSEYFDVYKESFEKTKKVFEDINVSGSIIIAKELFIADAFIIQSIIEEAEVSKRNIVAYNEHSTLFIYIAEDSYNIKEKLSNDGFLFNDLIELLSSDFEFEKLELDQEIAYLLASVKELCLCQDKLNTDRIDFLLSSGVFIKKPSTVQVDAGVLIEAGAIIGAGSVIKGKSFIASGTYIEENSRIIDSTIAKNCRIEGASIIKNTKIEENVLIKSSTITDSYIKKDAVIGPYAQLRPNTNVGEGVKIGNFVELKNSKIGDKTKISHLTYIGDADLGNNINVGCGVVFVNYNGVEKFRSTIEDNAFIGCNVNLVSPVHVGEGAFIAAGSTITDDIQPNQLAIARSRQSNKDGWKLNNNSEKNK